MLQRLRGLEIAIRELKMAFVVKFDWRDIALAGDRLAAIKMYKDLHNKNLKESKEAVGGFIERMNSKETV